VGRLIVKKRHLRELIEASCKHFKTAPAIRRAWHRLDSKGNRFVRHTGVARDKNDISPPAPRIVDCRSSKIRSMARFIVVLALTLLAACSQNHAPQSTSGKLVVEPNSASSPDPELCAGKGPRDSFTFGYALAREMHEAEQSNKRHEFRSAFSLARDARARVEQCRTIGGVVDSAYFDEFQAHIDAIAAESLIGLHRPDVAALDLRAADAVLNAGENASDATADTRKDNARLHQRLAEDLAELSRH